MVGEVVGLAGIVQCNQSDGRHKREKEREREKKRQRDRETDRPSNQESQQLQPSLLRLDSCGGRQWLASRPVRASTQRSDRGDSASERGPDQVMRTPARLR